MITSVAALRTMSPFLRRRNEPHDVQVKTVVVDDLKEESLASTADDNADDYASKELVTALDPDMNPGELTFEEGTHRILC